MTDSTTSYPTEGTPPRPYTQPALVALGSIDGLTAGPDGAKTLDGIVGGAGGFTQDEDPTS